MVITFLIVGAIMLLYGMAVYWVVIFLHELGHLIMSLYFGLKPSEFTVGGGPALRFSIKNFKFHFGLFPSGGEVRSNWTVDWRKLVTVLAAGMIANAVTALIVGVLALLGKFDHSTALQFIGMSLYAIANAWLGSDGQAIRAALKRKRRREEDYKNYVKAMEALKDHINVSAATIKTMRPM